VKALAVAASLLCGAAAAQEVDESALFSDTAMVKPEPSTSAKTDSVTKTQVRFGGSLEAVGQGSWKTGSVSPSSDGAARMVGTANLDVKLPSGQRALGVFEVAHEGASDTTSWALRELFLDADIGGVVWFRAGKQVIQWGRGILWTPTDLVNVEGRTLVERPGAREGATGLKVQVPFGTGGSITAFAPLRHVDNSDSLALSLRGEMLVGPAEVALSTRFKQDAPQVVGLDFSTGLLGLDAEGGVLWLSGDPDPRAVLRDGAWHLEKDDTRRQVRASAGLGRAFTQGGVPDRLRIDVEGYWQSEGYSSDVLTDATVRPFADTLWRPLDPRLVDGGRALGIPLPKGLATTRGDGLTFLGGNGLFHPNQFGPLYLGTMVSYAKFLIPDLTLTLQALGNVDDRSGVGTLGVTWESLYGFHVQPLVYAFWGDPRTEFVLDGRGFALELRTGLRF